MSEIEWENILNKNRNNLSRFINEKLFQNNLIFNCNPAYIFFQPIDFIKDLFREVKWVKQRIFRGWDDRLIWDTDYYLANHIPVWIETMLKNKNIGISQEFFDGLSMDEHYGYSEENEKIARDKMIVVLNKISNGFRAYQEVTDTYDKNKIEELTKEFDEGFLLFHKYFHILND